MFVFLVSLILNFSAAHARDGNPHVVRVGETYELKLENLHLTQFAAGLREVRWRLGRLQTMSGKKRRRYLKEHPIEAVIGPQGQIYVVDGHHAGLVRVGLGIETAPVEILADYSGLTEDEFWAKMIASNSVYLMKNGEGPLSPRLLPKSFRDMIDDPYRSLVSAVRRTGAFDKSMTHFAEFIWAEFFRHRIVLEDSDESFARAVETGVILAQSHLAADLPGFSGRRGGKCAELLVGVSRP